MLPPFSLVDTFIDQDVLRIIGVISLLLVMVAMLAAYVHVLLRLVFREIKGIVSSAVRFVKPWLP